MAAAHDHRRSPARRIFRRSTFWVLNGNNGNASNNNTNVLVSCEGYDTVPNPDQFTQLQRARDPRRAGRHRIDPRHRGRHDRIADESDEHDRRLHQDRDAGHQRNVARRHDGDPELGIWRPESEPDREQHGPCRVATRRQMRSCACSTCRRTRKRWPTLRPSAHALQLLGHAEGRRTTCPNVLFDTREAIYRDAVPATGQPRLGGVMHYVALDVAQPVAVVRGDRRLQQRQRAAGAEPAMAIQSISRTAATTGTRPTRKPARTDSRMSSTPPAPPARRATR